jgi:hypothetical protein
VSSSPVSRPIELRLSLELRRCVIYVAVGVLVLGFLVGLKAADLNGRLWWVIAIGWIVFASGVAGLLALAFRYRRDTPTRH